jgi:hypothetical protein
MMEEQPNLKTRIAQSDVDSVPIRLGQGSPEALEMAALCVVISVEQ